MTIVRAARADDIDIVIRLTQQSFNTQPSSHARIRERFVPADYLIAERNGSVVGTGHKIPFAHFFGGNPVSAAGVAGVAIAAQARGKGVGTTLMHELMRGLRDDGVLISSLYPATVPIYRSCGYGYGLVYRRWAADLRALPTDRSAADVEEFDAEDIAELDAVYQRIAREANGLVQRSRTWWEQNVVSSPWDDKPRYRYVVREGGEVTGWIIYSLAQVKDEWQFDVSCRDLFWTTPEAARALFGLASLHRSTGKRLMWNGPPDEPLLHLTADHTIEEHDTFHPMVRLLDVPGAFEARGYPSSVDVEVTIAVDDPLFPENNGPWRVAVSGGTAKVSRAEDAAARASIVAWASMWSAFLRPADAVRAGLLDAGPQAVRELEAMFAGPLPWIADFY